MADSAEATLIKGMAELAYPEGGGPEDGTIAEKAIFALRGVTADRDKLQEDVNELQQQIAGLQNQVREEEGAHDDVHAALLGRAEKAEAEAKNLREQLKESRKQTRTARAAVPKPDKPRAAKPAEQPMGKDERDALFEALEDSRHELVLSDGKREIRELESVPVEPANFERTTAGLVFADPVDVRGVADPKGRQLSVSGAAILDGDGKQVAYAALPEPVLIAPGQQVRFDRHFRF